MLSFTEIRSTDFEFQIYFHLGGLLEIQSREPRVPKNLTAIACLSFSKKICDCFFNRFSLETSKIFCLHIDCPFRWIAIVSKQATSYSQKLKSHRMSMSFKQICACFSVFFAWVFAYLLSISRKSGLNLYLLKWP